MHRQGIDRIDMQKSCQTSIRKNHAKQVTGYVQLSAA